MHVIPIQIFEQIPSKCTEGLALAQASDDDGAVMVFQWCNKAFAKISGHSVSEVVGQRGTILIGPDTEQGTHLLLIDKLMKWEHFSVDTLTNQKDGERLCVRMTWTPLSDRVSGSRWWLCSLFELPGEAKEPRQIPVYSPESNNAQILKRYSADILRLEGENKRLHELAKTVAKESNEDALTGLSNRRHFEVELKARVSALRKGGPEFAALYIDLDRFKSVNDTLGHDAGDSLLISVANMLRGLSSASDMVARLGGDEFVILKQLGASALNISALADDIIQKMRLPFEFEGKRILSSASVGVAIADSKMDHPDQVVADADTALYHAKMLGRGRWSFFTAEMHEESIETKRLATELLIACDQEQFIPVFQPIIDAETGWIASAETLVRWMHPDRGLLQPAAFLDVAANMGLLNQLDAIMFCRLREALADLDSAGGNLPKVTINVSAGRLSDPNLIHDIKSSGIEPNRLTIEILESVYLERMGDVVAWALEELNDLGVTIAVDDFGTGHASVQGLLQIKPTLLKIDRQFILPIIDDMCSRTLVASIIGIGRSLGMKIVAEGIETEGHAQIASDLGCDFLQGFHFGKPMNVSDLCEKLLETKGQFWRRQTVFAGSKKAVRARDL